MSGSYFERTAERDSPPIPFHHKRIIDTMDPPLFPEFLPLCRPPPLVGLFSVLCHFCHPTERNGFFYISVYRLPMRNIWPHIAPLRHYPLFIFFLMLEAMQQPIPRSNRMLQNRESYSSLMDAPDVHQSWLWLKIRNQRVFQL